MATHVPGRDQEDTRKFPDATSRFLTALDEAIDHSISEVLCNILGEDSDDEEKDELVLAASEEGQMRAITWDIVQTETEKDETMLILIKLI